LVEQTPDFEYDVHPSQSVQLDISSQASEESNNVPRVKAKSNASDMLKSMIMRQQMHLNKRYTQD